MKSYLIADHTGPNGLKLEERPKPTAGPGMAVVRIHAASLNYRDHMIASGAYGGDYDARGRIPLSDGAGVVTEVGTGVERVKPGQRVAVNFFPTWIDGPATAEMLAVSLGGAAADGVLSEFVTVPADALAILPDGLSFEAAATLPCAALTAWYGLFECGSARPGDVVVVQGTGGVSIFALQFAKAAGATVIATTSSAWKLDRLRALGADHVIDTQAHPIWASKVVELTKGRGADIILDVGGPNTLGQALEAVRTGGRVAVIGVLSGVSAPVELIPVLFKQIRLDGVYVGSRAMFDRMNQAIATNKLTPVVDKVFPFADVRDAFEYQAASRHVGKVVISIAS